MVEGTSEFDYTSPGEMLQQARDLTAYAMADAWLQFSVKLYDIIGPRISVGPFTEWFITTDIDRPFWAIDYGMAAKIELELNLWFKQWYWELWEGEIPVAALLDLLGIIQKCETYGPGLPNPLPKPCRTPAPETRVNGDERLIADRIRVVSAGKPFFELPPGPLADRDTGRSADRVRSSTYELALEKKGWFADFATWHVIEEDLVPGLSFDEETGKLTGTPSAGGISRAVGTTMRRSRARRRL